MTTEREMHELFEEEAWLRDALDEPDVFHTERARLLGGIAVSQEWLARTLHDVLPEGLIDRIKVLVAAEAARLEQRQRRGPSGMSNRTQYRWAVGVLAAAAALAFSVVGLRARPENRDYTASAALEEFREDDLGEMFAMLAEDIDELFDDEPASLGHSPLDELLNEVDTLLAVIEEDDWS